MASKRYTLGESLTMSPDDLKGMSKGDLLKILAPIRDAANKRINRLEKAGQPSPALAAIQKTGGKLYGGKWTTNKELRKEINRGIAFLNYQTSTVKGARQYEKKMTGSIPGNMAGTVRYGDLTPHQVGLYWDAMHKMRESGVQLSGEDYDIIKALIRNSVASGQPENVFLASIPAESHEYVMNAMNSVSLRWSDDEERVIDKILTGINSYLDWKVDEGYVTEDEEEDEEDDWFFL